jgi:hypothetical protein
VSSLLWPLFARSEWEQSATVAAGKTGEGAALAFVLLVVVSSENQCGAITSGVGAALASVLSVGVGQFSHCCGGHEK